MPPQTPEKQTSTDLSEAEADKLQAYAQARGLDIHQAATELAKEALTQRYRRANAAPGLVIPIRKR